MVRRQVLRGLFTSSIALTVTACGGGSGGGSSTLSSSGGVAAAPAPPPPPPPAPAPPPPPTPTLRGITIEQAEADIASHFASPGQWMDAVRSSQGDTVVTSADGLAAAAAAAFDVKTNAAVLATHQRILCAWNGDSTLAAGPTARLNVSGKTLADSHLSQGGSLTIAAAPGYAPNLANTVHVSGRGIKFQGLGFTRRLFAGEDQDTVNAVTLVRSNTYPVISFVGFEDCWFGQREMLDHGTAARWVNGIATSGQAAEFVSLTRCSFIGHQNAAKIVARALRVDRCDFQGVLQDCLALYGHTFEADYHAMAWISRTTFRNSGDNWDKRSEHSDAIQTGTKADRHLGYRLLVTDVVTHLARSYSGEAGMGGGAQGIYNDDHLTADNQFVIRRSVFLTTTPHGFCYYSPRASRPSFVDKSVFTRAGRVPSAFAPDPLSQDFAVGITGTEPADGPWLLVTDTIAKNMMKAGNSITVASVDPRVASIIASAERPEAYFAGRDFGRGTSAVNGQAGKFGYRLPNEGGRDPSRFVDDVWANFRPLGAHTDKGAPNPTGIAWAA